MKRNRSLGQLTLIHFREFIREPGILFWSIIFPVLMAWVLGVAFSKPPQVNDTVAFVPDGNAMNTEFREFISTGQISKNENGLQVIHKEIASSELGKMSFKFVFTGWDNAIILLKRGQASMILKEKKDSIEYHFDPRNPEAKLGYVMLSQAVRHDDIASGTQIIKPLTTIGTRYIDFLVPGLLAMGLMNSLIWGISYGLIEMRVKKLLRRMVATPMRKSEFLASHFIARFVLSIVEALILFTFARIYFHIRVEGSLSALFLVFVSGNIVFAGLSILLSARVENNRVGTGLINFIIMPMTILSGIFFSYHNFPDFIVPFIRVLPLTMLADSMRSVFIEGAGILQVLKPTLILSALGMVCFITGLKTYKWY